IDVEEKRIEEILKGVPTFHEPQLKQMIKTAVRKKWMEFTTDASRVSDSSTVFLTVGTPSKDDGSIDLSYVKKATQDVGSAIAGSPTYHLVVVKSTVTPGTTTDVVCPVLEAATGMVSGHELGL